MKLQTALTILCLIVFSLTLTLLNADKPLERLGNEAAATADSLYAENKFIEAARKYEEAYNLFIRAEQEDEIPLSDKINQMLTNMLTSYYQGEDFENSIRVIQKRLAAEPQNDTYARQIAQIYERQLQRPDRALEVLIDFDRNNSNFAVRRTIARLYVDTDRLAEAVEWYEKTFELRQDPEVLQNIALLYNRLGNPAKAIETYENFLETNPREAVLINVYRNMGRFYEDLGNDDKAIEYYERTNRMRFNRDITLLLLTKYYDRGDYLNAREKVTQLLRDNANNPDAIYYRAMMFFEEGRFAEAKTEFQKIVNDRRYGTGARQYIESIDSM